MWELAVVLLVLLACCKKKRVKLSHSLSDRTQDSVGKIPRRRKSSAPPKPVSFPGPGPNFPPKSAEKPARTTPPKHTPSLVDKLLRRHSHTQIPPGAGAAEAHSRATADDTKTEKTLPLPEKETPSIPGAPDAGTPGPSQVLGTLLPRESALARVKAAVVSRDLTSRHQRRTVGKGLRNRLVERKKHKEGKEGRKEEEEADSDGPRGSFAERRYKGLGEGKELWEDVRVVREPQDTKGPPSVALDDREEDADERREECKKRLIGFCVGLPEDKALDDAHENTARPSLNPHSLKKTQ